jgi:hypothetical protein
MCLKCPVCLLPTGPNIITSLDLCHPQDLDCVCVCGGGGGGVVLNSLGDKGWPLMWAGKSQELQ